MLNHMAGHREGKLLLEREPELIIPPMPSMGFQSITYSGDGVVF